MMSATKKNSTTMIVVCCHAIYIGSSEPDPCAGRCESSDWLVEPFQTGETPTFIQHIRAGVEQLHASLSRNEDAILVFSGGQTKRSRGCVKSEAQGYLDLCLARGLFGLETSPPTLRQRLFAEQYATDSYQNILLSVIQYPIFRRQCALHRESADVDISWPEELVIVSHDFKRDRFIKLHVPAMALPINQIHYMGIDPPFSERQLAEVIEGDRLRGYGAWEQDLRGTGTLLQQKRIHRGWDGDVFMRDVVKTGNHWDTTSQQLLQALIKGDGQPVWPE